MQGREGRFQLTLPEHLRGAPTRFAIENNWYTRGRKPSSRRTRRVDGETLLSPATSFAVSALLAHADALPYAQRQAMLLDGARRVFEAETTWKVPGRERVRIYQSDAVRPAGIKARDA